MKKKLISVLLTEKEYDEIREASYKDRISISTYAGNILRRHINGNKPPSEKPATETNKETIHTDEPGIEVKDNTQLTFDDIEM